MAKKGMKLSGTKAGRKRAYKETEQVCHSRYRDPLIALSCMEALDGFFEDIYFEKPPSQGELYDKSAAEICHHLRGKQLEACKVGINTFRKSLRAMPPKLAGKKRRR